MNISIEQIKLISQFKKELKLEAAALQRLKQDTKNAQREGDVATGDLQFKIIKNKNKFRHRHIAYCMLRGKKYNEIEKKCRCNPNFKTIELIKGKYTYHGTEETISAAA